MRLIRVHVEAPLAAGGRVTFEGPAAAHVRRVLRLEAGDPLTLFNGDGHDYPSRIAGFGRGTVEAEIQERAAARAESPLSVTLVQGVARGERMDLVVQKATELGVTKVVPLITRHADIHLRDEADATKRVARWQRIALEAAKQSGRAFVPEVSAPVAFDSLLASSRDGLRVMFSERGGAALGSLTPSQIVTALVGSEGGWSDEEIEQAKVHDFHIVTLGGRVLRAETAAITVTALLQHLFGDLR